MPHPRMQAGKGAKGHLAVSFLQVNLENSRLIWAVLINYDYSVCSVSSEAKNHSFKGALHPPKHYRVILIPYFGPTANMSSTPRTYPL